MTNDQKKMLTEEVLGECWHDYRIAESLNSDTRNDISKCSCGITGYSVREICAKSNRPFTIWQDLGDLKEKIVEMGEWVQFREYVWIVWYDSKPDVITALDGYESVANFDNWLINPTRFCELCASWWQERKVKGLVDRATGYEIDNRLE